MSERVAPRAAREQACALGGWPLNMPSRARSSAALLTSIASVVALVSVVAGCDRKANEAPSEPPSAAPAPTPLPSASVAHAAPVKVEIDEVRIRPEASTTVRVAWNAPAGTDVNADAPFRVRWNRSDGLAEPPNDVTSTGSSVKDGFRVDVKPMKGAPNPTLGGEISLVVCDSATHVICVPVKRSLELGFIVVKDAAAEAKVTVPLPEARGH